MAFIPTPNTFRVALNFQSSGQTGVNTLWFTKGTPIVAGDATTLAVALKNWWDTYGKQCVPVNTTLTSIDVVDQNSLSSPSLHYDVSPDIPGTAAGTPAVLNCSPVVSFRTSGRGRSARGRNYIYGISETDTNNDGVTMGSALQSNLSILFANLAGFLASSGLVHAVVSHYLNKTPRLTGLSQPVTNYVIDLALDSQRRRLLGRGV